MKGAFVQKGAVGIIFDIGIFSNDEVLHPTFDILEFLILENFLIRARYNPFFFYFYFTQVISAQFELSKKFIE
jgi:hypothetical protein